MRPRGVTYRSEMQTYCRMYSTSDAYVVFIKMQLGLV